ncbi:hypothetical protein HPB49_002237 [Dermacentor silvarum]|uniref:Uncharacterized protein n=1 Tax=Dermacentor silvarum TaxID=543639 RepID=A0ACB8DHX1_DERSI|nr:hypothetical protein HPB49_002237 [Dermacentor silvarum]
MKNVEAAIDMSDTSYDTAWATLSMANKTKEPSVKRHDEAPSAPSLPAPLPEQETHGREPSPEDAVALAHIEEPAQEASKEPASKGFVGLPQKDQRGWTLDTWIKRPPCPQQDFYLGHQLVSTSNASEDCLHLNIWTPPSSCGSTKEQEACELRTLYDGRYLSALGNLVVVVPNYRVGPLGFLSSRVGTSLPGNLGLHDQRLALEWTRANIDSFGGSALHLVLAGHDAGATSLGYHLFSGDTTFWTQNVDRFILQSGGPFHSYEGQNVEGARQLIASLRCPGDISSEVTLGCLQRAHVDAIARSPMAPSFVPVFGREPLPRPQPLEARNTSAQEVCPMSELAEQLYAWHNRVYVYVLGYRPSYSSWLSETAAVHFEDMELVFGMPLRPDVVSSDLDKAWSRTMIQVKPPAVNNLSWPRYDSTMHTIMKLGPHIITEQGETKRKRCNLLRDTSLPH